MVAVAFALLYLAVAGAFVAWIAGAVFFVRTLAALGEEDRGTRWLAIVAWPFAVKRLKGRAADDAARVNKAIVAFIACIIVAAAAMSAATNLQRVSSYAPDSVQR
jgi:nitrate/nitrite transporter NarK